MRYCMRDEVYLLRETWSLGTGVTAPGYIENSHPQDFGRIREICLLFVRQVFLRCNSPFDNRWYTMRDH